MIPLAYKQHCENCELAIAKLVSLHKDGYNISDETIFKSVLARYGLLKDGFCDEREYIIKEVTARLKGV